jgi:hypothetical protein
MEKFYFILGLIFKAKYLLFVPKCHLFFNTPNAPSYILYKLER